MKTSLSAVAGTSIVATPSFTRNGTLGFSLSSDPTTDPSAPSSVLKRSATRVCHAKECLDGAVLGRVLAERSAYQRSDERLCRKRDALKVPILNHHAEATCVSCVVHEALHVGGEFHTESQAAFHRRVTRNLC